MSISERARTFLGNPEELARFFWALALLTLPVTSFRYFPFLGDSTQVRPLALYPLLPLMVILFLRFVRREIPKPFPGSLILLGMFVLVLILSTILGPLYAPLELRGQDYWGRALRALVTIVIGLMFFIAAIWMNRDEEDLRFSIKWLLLGLCLHIIWASVQAFSFYTSYLPRPILVDMQLSFSIRVPVKNERFSALAYEPSWLAGQIATVYMPWLFAALLTQYRLSRFRWVEPLLFLLTVVLLVMTFSRGGILYTLIAAGITALIVGREQLVHARDWFLAPFGKSHTALNSQGRDFAVRLILIVLVLAIVTGAGTLMTQQAYFSKLFSGLERAETLEEYIVYNYAGARAAYAIAAMGAYRDHPWLGVGMGASGFYIYDNLPDWSRTTLFDVARQLDPNSRQYPNPKSMYVRLFAETGLIGFILFLAFQLSLLADVRRILQSGRARFLGIAAMFTWIALILYNATQDSFATPNLWINLGIMLGLARTLISDEGGRELS